MMVHLEGPIVDSLYDNLLLSWHETFDPKLPCLREPSPNSNPEKPFEYKFSDENPYLEHIDIAKAARAARMLLTSQRQAEQQGNVNNQQSSVPQWWQYERWDGVDRQAAHRPQNQSGFATMVQNFIERAKEEANKALGDGQQQQQRKLSQEQKRMSVEQRRLSQDQATRISSDKAAPRSSTASTAVNGSAADTTSAATSDAPVQQTAVGSPSSSQLGQLMCRDLGIQKGFFFC